MFHCIGTLHGHFNKSNIVEHSPSCLMKLFPDRYKAHVSAIILNMINAKKYNVKFHRVTNNGDDHYESMTLNYTMDKNPTFRSYNPFTGGFLAQPNTMPWIVSLSFGYAVLLNESEKSPYPALLWTRFVLTTGPCIRYSQ
uniref:Uncharacterized protein n=1 Tax=Romanomermis culicivorax TaxID=13658 RepID=A0A915KHV4_ROMCU